MVEAFDQVQRSGERPAFIVPAVGRINREPLTWWRNGPFIGQTYRVGLYWVEVVGYSPKTRNVRYRRITAKGKPLAPVESMGRKRFDREATPA